MKGSYDYKFRDFWRNRFMNEDWSIEEIENKIGFKVSYHLIPDWMRNEKAKIEKEIAELKRKQKIENDRYLKRYRKEYAAFQKQRDKDRAPLKPKHAEKVKEMSKPFKKANALSRTKKIKQNQNAGERWLSSRSIDHESSTL